MDDSSPVLHPFPELHYAQNHPPQGHQRFGTLKKSKDPKIIHPCSGQCSATAQGNHSFRAVGRPESMKTELQHLAGGRRTRIIVIDIIRFRSLFAIPHPSSTGIDSSSVVEASVTVRIRIRRLHYLTGIIYRPSSLAHPSRPSQTS
ncbi:hypothetical protein C8J56DRAFT_1052148 [Mycena floridula]|nr:hypothetical protein C8J56DRAFT_1052148 [Mycena floridula]